MTGEYSELVVEFGVILLSPILFHYYLWKVKKVDFTEIKKIKIFTLLYALFVLVGLYIILKKGRSELS
jgi:hypothetical protein